jgi:hypothetical protein
MRRVCEQLQQVGPRVRLALIEGETGHRETPAGQAHPGAACFPGMLVAEEATGLFCAESSPQQRAPPRSPPRRHPQGGRRHAADPQYRRIGGRASGAAAALHPLLRNFARGEKPGALPSPSQVICTARKTAANPGAAGAFLPEIYYRLSAVSFSLPALRDRKEDIPALAQMFIDAVSREQQRPLQGLGPGSLPILLRHLWPGNVRELESVIRAACLSSEGQWLRPIDLVILPLEPAGSKDGEPAIPENFTLDGVIRRHILQVLKACDGNKARAASKLGISRSTLYRMLETEIALPMRSPTCRTSSHARFLPDCLKQRPHERGALPAPPELARPSCAEKHGKPLKT